MNQTRHWSYNRMTNQTRTLNLLPYDEIKQEHSTYTLMTKSNKNIQLTPYTLITKSEHSTDNLLTKSNKNIQLTTYNLHPYYEIKQEHSTDNLLTKSNKNMQLTPYTLITKSEHSTDNLLTKSNKNIQLTTYNWHPHYEIKQEHSSYTLRRNQTRTFNWHPYYEVKQEHSSYTLRRNQTRTFNWHPHDEIIQEHSSCTLTTKSNSQVTPLWRTIQEHSSYILNILISPHDETNKLNERKRKVSRKFALTKAANDATHAAPITKTSKQPSDPHPFMQTPSSTCLTYYPSSDVKHRSFEPFQRPHETNRSNRSLPTKLALHSIPSKCAKNLQGVPADTLFSFD